MPRFPALRQGFPAYLLRIAIAFLTVPAVGLLRWLASPWLHVQNSLIVFIPAVMFATWFGGLWPGLAAMVLAAFVGESEVAGPAGLLAAQNHEFIRILLFLITGAQVALGTEILHRRTREARAANHAKDLFLSILSHELRTPLTPALAAASDLAADTALPDAIRDHAGVIRRNILLEVRLIDDLLDISRIQKGKLVLKREIVDVDRLLQQALHTCAQAIAAKHLTVHFHTTSSPCRVNADPARLQQVFWNLLRNAVKFTPDHGAISINITEANPHAPGAAVVVQISDNGVGIPPEHLRSIFSPFEQGHADTPRQFGGLGLGLAISRSLVKLHGGSLSAASDGPGKGATFIVRLPLSEFLPAADPLPDPALRPAPLRILYVEDHPDTLAVMTRLLHKLGHTVHPAPSLADALRLARQHPLDLLISDLSLPDGSGIDLLGSLRTTHPRLPAIAISGHGSPDDLRRSKAAGFAHHLTKPLDIAELQHAITTLPAPAPLPRAALL